jgi:hypothetical protein
MLSNLVVAHYLDGRVVKGTSLDVDPAKPTCHVRPPTGPVQDVKLADLKALFFVRSLEGNATREEARTPDPSDPRLKGSSPIALRFRDGESMLALTNRFPPNRPHFFVVPLDPAANNVRILVNRAAVMSMESPTLG